MSHEVSTRAGQLDALRGLLDSMIDSTPDPHAGDRSAAERVSAHVVRLIEAEPGLVDSEREELSRLLGPGTETAADIEELRGLVVRRLEAAILSADAPADEELLRGGLELLRDQLRRRAAIVGYQSL